MMESKRMERPNEEDILCSFWSYESVHRRRKKKCRIDDFSKISKDTYHIYARRPLLIGSTNRALRGSATSGNRSGNREA